MIGSNVTCLPTSARRRARIAYLSAFRSSVAKIVTDVVRDDVDGAPSYLLHCERSSGQYLFDVLVDAGDEFGLEVAGFVNLVTG